MVFGYKRSSDMEWENGLILAGVGAEIPSIYTNYIILSLARLWPNPRSNTRICNFTLN